MEDKKNPRPAEEGSQLPTVTLLVLLALIGVLLFVGWQYLKDDSISDNELTNAGADSIAVVGNANEFPVVAESSDKSEKEETTEASKATEKTKKEEEKPSKKAKKEEPKTETTKVVDLNSVKGEIITHTVQAGETFFGIANRYNLKWQSLQKLNPSVNPDGIKVGVTKLKVKIQTIHTVGPGDVLRVVAQKYGVSKALIMQANKKTKDFTERGEKLIIPLK